MYVKCLMTTNKQKTLKRKIRQLIIEKICSNQRNKTKMRKFIYSQRATHTKLENIYVVAGT